MTNRSFSSLLSYFIALCVLSSLLLFFDTQKILFPIHNGFDTIAAPIKTVFFRLGQNWNQTIGFLSFWKNGTAKISYLEQRVAELTVDSERISALEKENIALKDQIGVTNPNDYTLILAGTTGLDRFLSLNKGERNGVKKGMMVLSHDILIGVVNQTTPITATVMLLTDPGIKIPVKTVKTGAKGLLTGRFGASMLLGKVVQEDELQINDTVVTSGEGDIPKGFIVGNIVRVMKKEDELFQTAEVKPLFDTAHLENVFVVKPL